jgi:hypothetical protein
MNRQDAKVAKEKKGSESIKKWYYREKARNRRVHRRG